MTAARRHGLTYLVIATSGGNMFTKKPKVTILVLVLLLLSLSIVNNSHAALTINETLSSSNMDTEAFQIPRSASLSMSGGFSGIISLQYRPPGQAEWFSTGDSWSTPGRYTFTGAGEGYYRLLASGISGQATVWVEILNNTDDKITNITVSDEFLANIRGSALYKSVSNVVSSSTNETDLHRYTVAAAGLTNTSGAYTGGVWFEFWGTKTGSGGNKTIKLKWGSQTVVTLPVANDTNNWKIIGTITANNNISSQKIDYEYWDGTTHVREYTTGSQNNSVTIELKVTGQCVVGTDAVTGVYGRVNTN